VFSAHKGHKRRFPGGRLAAPLVAVAVAAAGAFLIAPAHAGQGSTTAANSQLTNAQLRTRINSAAGHLTTPNTVGAAKSTRSAAKPAGGSATVKPRIIGGSSTPISSAPWMVQLIYLNSDGSGIFCGGTLVAPNKVLTAGHCVEGLNWVQNGAVLGGTATLLPETGGQVSAVRAQWLHPGYDGTAVNNDVAILTLATPFNYKTLPLASATDTSLYNAGTQATVYGWGVTDSAPDSQNLAENLQKLTLPEVADSECKSELGGALDDPNAFIPGHMICGGTGGTGDDATGKTTCSGDSGGPLVVSGKIVGIVSWGVSDDIQDCNVPGTYDVFTKVSAYGGNVQSRINDSDISRDFRADVLAETSAGQSFEYDSTGSNLGTRHGAPISSSNYDTVVQADLERDGYQDYIMRAKGTGNVFMAHRTPTRASYSYIQVGVGWNTRKAIVVPGDLTGDGIPDLLSEDSAGKVYIYSGKGNGLFNTPVLAGTGWLKYNLVVGHGDYTGDGKADVFARDAKTGALYLLAGTGSISAPFAAPVQVATGWNGFNAVIASGDVTGDGRSDLLARTPSGALFLFKGTFQSGTAIFSPWVKIGTGWNMYSRLS
jgi:secreted trypsin-like serine protease